MYVLEQYGAVVSVCGIGVIVTFLVFLFFLHGGCFVDVPLLQNISHPACGHNSARYRCLWGPVPSSWGMLLCCFEFNTLRVLLYSCSDATCSVAAALEPNLGVLQYLFWALHSGEWGWIAGALYKSLWWPHSYSQQLLCCICWLLNGSPKFVWVCWVQLGCCSSIIPLDGDMISLLLKWFHWTHREKEYVRRELLHIAGVCIWEFWPHSIVYKWCSTKCMQPARYFLPFLMSCLVNNVPPMYCMWSFLE